MDNKETRDAYHQVAQDRNALVRKTKQTTRNERNSSSEGMSSDGSGSESDDDAMKQKTVQKIRAEVFSDGEAKEGGSSDNENSDDSSEAPDGTVRKMDFSDATRQGKTKKSNDEDEKGIMGLKFMRRAEEREKEALKLKAELAVKQINGDDDY